MGGGEAGRIWLGVGLGDWGLVGGIELHWHLFTSLYIILLFLFGW